MIIISQSRTKSTGFEASSALNSSSEGENEQQMKSNSVAEILNRCCVNLIKSDLDIDPDSADLYPNQTSRRVRSGHYVETKPEPLPKPFLIAYSQQLLQQTVLPSLKVDQKIDNGVLELLTEVTQIFSGKNDAITSSAWATPYAVSVSGSPILAPDQFNGYGYGDGRAMSLGHYIFINHDATGDLESNSALNDGGNSADNSEVMNRKNELAVEFQLKGSGRSPFSRFFDGRAVLRSSIREFIASEFMHNAGVPTTRGFCLVASEEEFVDRAWYRNDVEAGEQYEYPPNYLTKERCAIATRACSSFIRIGHFELYARRMRALDGSENLAKEQLLKLLLHTLKREFPQVLTKHGFDANNALTVADISADIIIDLLKEVALNLAKLVNNWIRVGYVQGNMNSDNILLNGCTMDYGPFGFMERYDPILNPFTSDPAKNYGFERQPRAMQINFAGLVDSMLPLIETLGSEAQQNAAIEVVKSFFPEQYLRERNEMRRCKLGFLYYEDKYDTELISSLYEFLPHLDYTMFWRILSESFSGSAEENLKKTNKELIEPFKCACYTEYLVELEGIVALSNWLKKYLQICKNQGKGCPDKELMLKANPKYIPREWMLVETYQQAKKLDEVDIDPNNLKGETFRTDPSLPFANNVSIFDLWHGEEKFGKFSKLYALQMLFENPFTFHNDEAADLFFRPTPATYRNKPGTSFYSCSS